MALSEETIEFFKQTRILMNHSSCMSLATNYHKDKFNYGRYGDLLRKVLKEIGIEDEIKRVYPYEI